MDNMVHIDRTVLAEVGQLICAAIVGIFIVLGMQWHETEKRNRKGRGPWSK